MVIISFGLLISTSPLGPDDDGITGYGVEMTDFITSSALYALGWIQVV
jgi:hypothetical protein